jgi:hypothetical protein
VGGGVLREEVRVDRLLDDKAFFAPFVPFFHPRCGQPSTPHPVAGD